MTAYIKIGTGSYRNEPIRNKVFPVIKNFTTTAKTGTFVTVDGSKLFGVERSKIRIKVDPSNCTFVKEELYIAQSVALDLNDPNETIEVEVDEEVRMAEIAERFDILHDMTKAMMKRKIRGMIVSGPPGIGKSFGVERELSKLDLFTDVGGKARKTEVVKGAMTALGLYVKLHEFKDEGSVLVFDDCDSVLMDDLSLNLLKAALDSGRTRNLYWNADSQKLKTESVPNKFEFKGSVCFITNIKFENVRSKRLQDHLLALQSRCHYLDLTLDTMRDKILRVKQIARTGNLFANYKFPKEDEKEILDFMYENKEKLNEVSLRMALKLADCKMINADRWKAFAKATCMRRA